MTLLSELREGLLRTINSIEMVYRTTKRILVFLLILFSFCFSIYAQEVEIQSSGQIKNVKDPVDPQDVATKAYVDNIVINYFSGLPNGLQTLLDAGECPLNMVNAGISKDSLIGKNYQGGIIFYLDDQDTISGMKGLVAAPEDQDNGGDFSIPWGCSGTNLPISDVTSGPSGAGAEIGDGETNTTGIDTASCSMAGDAASICANLSLDGYEDWFLPSAKELNEMYQRIGQGASGANQNIGGFTGSFYWSSSESGDSEAWNLFFFVGGLFKDNKNGPNRVRAVRAF